jgi:hypothetical protein
MSTILIIHITSAILLTAGMTSLLISSIIRSRQRVVLYFTRMGLGATVGTGIGLVVVSPGSMTHLCMVMTCYTFVAIGLEVLYKKRIKSTLHPDAATI